MPIAVLKVLALFVSPKDILKWVIGFLMFLILFFVIILAGPLTLAKKMPLASPSQVQIYVDAAKEAGRDRVEPNWQYLMAIDAVRLNQDFKQADKNTVLGLANRFILETNTKDGTEYSLRSLDEVLSNLAAEGMLKYLELQQVKDFLSFDLTILRDVGTGVPPGWVPIETLWKWPTPGFLAVSSGFGPRVDPVEHLDGYHQGIDMPVPEGTIVIASKAGIVAAAGKAWKAGLRVEIDHRDGTRTRYLHLSAVLVRLGETVNAGQQIAYSGNTGKSTGPHLHFEIWRGGRAVNPINFFSNGGI